MIRTACTVWAAAIAFAALGAVVPAPADAAPRTEYMPCASEDERNCVWDARHTGNGEGRSFFVSKSGHVTYLPHHVAHYLVNGDAR